MAKDRPSENHRLLVSTRNAHKIGEIRAILGPSFEVLDLSAVPDMPEVDETGSTFEENATLKCVAASMRFDGWTIADDSGLEVDALGGAPGVISARYSGEGATDAKNNALLLENLQNTPPEARTARFRCVIVLCRAGRKLAAFAGAVEGTILNAPQGEGGFGYDPLFVPNGYTDSFAVLGPDEKNKLSHRSQALAKMAAWGGWW